MKVSIQQVIFTFTADTSGDSPCSGHVLTMMSVRLTKIPGCTRAIGPVPENNAAAQWWWWGGRAHLWISSYLCVDHWRAEWISQNEYINVCIAPFKISDSTLDTQNANVKMIFHWNYRRLHKVKYYYKLQTMYLQKKCLRSHFLSTFTWKPTYKWQISDFCLWIIKFICK